MLDYVIVNSERAPEQLYQKYKEEGATRVKYEEGSLDKYDVQVVSAPLMTKEDLLRHDPEKLAKAIMRLV